MSLIVTNLDDGQTDAALSLQHLGALLTESGVLTPTSLTVTAQVSPNMSVRVSGSDNNDKAIIITDNGDTYFVKNTANENVTILANTSGVTKTDAIVLYVDLTGGDPDNAGSPGAAHLIAVRRASVSTGAPTSGENDAATSNNPWLKLKEVTVTHNTGEIESGDLLPGYVVPSALVAKAIIEPLGTDQYGQASVTSPKIVASGATLSKTSNQSLTNNTVTAIIFDTEDSDTDNYHSGVNPSRLTVPSTGRYLITFNITYDANATGNRFGCICVNGASTQRYGASLIPNAGAVNSSHISGSATIPLTAGDYVEVFGFQTSGGALNAIGGSVKTGVFSITRLGT
jgi:hypothetical protein